MPRKLILRGVLSSYVLIKGWFFMQLLKIILFLTVSLMLSGCVLTKLVTVPMRVGGAVVSIIPAAGNTMHDAVDESADIIDDIPF